MPGRGHRARERRTAPSGLAASAGPIAIARVPVTAETHFRAGSVSKSFVALALVQLYEDGKLDLDAKVADLVPEVAHRQSVGGGGASHGASSARAHGRLRRHALQRGVRPRRRARPAARTGAACATRRRAGCAGGPAPGCRTPIPATRVAGLVVEKVSGKPLRRVHRSSGSSRRSRCATSSFRLAPEADTRAGAGLRCGRRAAGRPAPHLPAAGRARSTPRPAELAHFVQALLGWGERGARLRRRSRIPLQHGVAAHAPWPVAPECGPATDSASTARSTFPYHVLGHNGGIDGFLSTYGYSPSRDVGYVVLINSTHASRGADPAVVAGDPLPEARRRAATEAVARRSRRTCCAATRATTAISARATRSCSRSQYVAGRPHGAPRRRPAGAGPDFGGAEPLVPVEDTACFRREREIDASLAFTEDEDGAAGADRAGPLR